MNIRPRRLRGNEILRKMVRETRVDKSSLIYPVFVRVKLGLAVALTIKSQDGKNSIRSP